MSLLLLSFLAGALTVLAPCTLALLPVIVGGSVGEGKGFGRALTVVVSLVLSIFVFTLLLKVSTAFIGVPPSVWGWLSGALLIVFGLVTLFPGLWERFTPAEALNRSGNRMLAHGYTRQSFAGDVIIGAALGPVFSSCSPTYFILLATVLPARPAEGILYLVVYSVGLALALLGIAIAGQRLTEKLGIASDPGSVFKRAVGALVLAVGIVIFLGYDKTVESYVLDRAGIFDVTKVEQWLLGANNMPTSAAPPSGAAEAFLSPEQKGVLYLKAPELARADAYLNTDGEPVSLAQYRGTNVVLIDFWTYSCINCLRTLPYVEAWYVKYKDQGLVIIGVHTPEFAFERVQANVEAAMKRLGVMYPVLLDNEYQTWSAFGNQYWPRKYLIDIDGYIVYDHAGEGEYDRTEAAIQKALRERAARLGETTAATGTVSVAAERASGVGSPETYFGAARNEYFGNGTQHTVGAQTLSLPSVPFPNTLYLSGTWYIDREYATNRSASAKILYRYRASKVFFVAMAPEGATITVTQDGTPLGAAAGKDVPGGTATIKESRLYELVDNPDGSGEHTLEITVSGTGLQAYTFTFG